METAIYAVYAGILGVISIFTHEIVTYALLGFILIALNNVLAVLRELSRKLDS